MMICGNSNMKSADISKPWTDEDQSKYIMLMNMEELTPEEGLLTVLIAHKMKSLLKGQSTSDLQVDLLEKSLALVDDLKADGAKLTSSDSAKMVLLLMNAGDNMIDRFTLIKKAGRCRDN